MITDTPRCAASQSVNQVKRLSRRSINFVQLVVCNGVFQAQVGGIVNGRQMAAHPKIDFGGDWSADYKESDDGLGCDVHDAHSD